MTRISLVLVLLLAGCGARPDRCAVNPERYRGCETRDVQHGPGAVRPERGRR